MPSKARTHNKQETSLNTRRLDPSCGRRDGNVLDLNRGGDYMTLSRLTEMYSMKHEFHCRQTMPPF